MVPTPPASDAGESPLIKEPPRDVMSPRIGVGMTPGNVESEVDEVEVMQRAVKELKARRDATKEKNRVLLENHMRTQSMFEAQLGAMLQHAERKETLQTYSGDCLARASAIQHRYLTGEPTNRPSCKPPVTPWTAYLDKHSNKVYYYNSERNITTWDPPRDDSEVDTTKLFQHI
eukprot:TRINITY_DN19504_c0_g2_i1.p1 TRINITY_DN19504_c0_g2~~TRINITY_DN19504_c0_g2_i1.p1  ORF type:complete len:174 (+),score=39.64 TRINITY_DN19504_c0_g2_i1:48-569(+)